MIREIELIETLLRPAQTYKIAIRKGERDKDYLKEIMKGHEVQYRCVDVFYLS